MSDVTEGVAGGELCEPRDVPDDGEDDHGHDVDGAGEAAEPVPGISNNNPIPKVWASMQRQSHFESGVEGESFGRETLCTLGVPS